MKEFRCGDIVPSCDEVIHLDRWPDLMVYIEASARREGAVLREQLTSRSPN